MKTDARIKGFTLIELSVVIIVLGLLTAALLNLYSSYIKQKELTVTADSIKASQEALQAFRDKTGFYPCPADPADTSGKATDCAAAATGAVKVASGTGGREVRIGTMPILDLSGENKLIQKSQAIDGYGNRLTYAVTTGMAIDPSTGGAAVVLGGIKVINANGAEQTSTASHIVLSHGDDGQGGYSPTGSVIGACDSGNKDAENCNGDAVFMSDQRSYSRDGNYTDDYLDFDTASRTDPLGPCTLFLNQNGTNYYNHNNSISSGYAPEEETDAMRIAPAHRYIYGGGAQGYDGGQFMPPSGVYPTKGAEEYAKEFDFKAVHIKTGEVLCVYSYRPPPPATPEGGGGEGGGGGNGGGGAGGGY